MLGIFYSKGTIIVIKIGFVVSNIASFPWAWGLLQTVGLPNFLAREHAFQNPKLCFWILIAHVLIARINAFFFLYSKSLGSQTWYHIHCLNAGNPSGWGKHWEFGHICINLFHWWIIPHLKRKILWVLQLLTVFDIKQALDLMNT